MNVFVDAAILKPKLGGIATYIRELCRALSSEASLTIATGFPELLNLNDVGIVEIPRAAQKFTIRALWRETCLPREVDKSRSDVLLSPAPELSLARVAVPRVVVVHDIGPIIRPDLYPLAKRLRFGAPLRRTIRSATVVVAVSEATRKDLVSVGASANSRTLTIGEAPASTFKSIKRVQKSPDSAIYVGSALRHKNLQTVVAAFDQIGTQRLVMIGPGTERYTGVSRVVDARGWVSEEGLMSALGDASFVVCPSLHEGFGLPIVEARAAGLPVLASDIPVFREIATTGVHFVDPPESVAAWMRAIEFGFSEWGNGRGTQVTAVTSASWEDIASHFMRLFAEIA